MNRDKMIFRAQNACMGRRVSVSRSNSSMCHLAYGRIVLSGNKRTEIFSTGDRETGFIFFGWGGEGLLWKFMKWKF
jgi:hypothetical protein